MVSTRTTSTPLTGFWIKKVTPHSYACVIISLLLTCESMIKLMSGYCSRAFFTKWMPSITGISRSTITMSGVTYAKSSSASTPLEAVPHTSPSFFCWMIIFKILQTLASSSMR